MKEKGKHIMERVFLSWLLIGAIGLILSVIGLIFKHDPLYFTGIFIALPVYLFGLILALLIVLMYIFGLAQILRWIFRKLTKTASPKKPEPLDYDFNAVRCVCYACGWFRVIGFSGCKGSRQALIRINPDKSDCNLCH